jgi:hypothetical protein
MFPTPLLIIYNNKYRWYSCFFSMNTHYFFLKIERHTPFILFFCLTKKYERHFRKLRNEYQRDEEIFNVKLYIYCASQIRNQVRDIKKILESPYN